MTHPKRRQLSAAPKDLPKRRVPSAHIYAFWLFLLTLGICSAVSAAPRTITVGVITDGSAARSAPLIDLFMEEIITLNAQDFTITAPANKRLYGDQNIQTIQKGLDTLMADDEVQIILTLGPTASHIGAKLPTHRKPLFAPFILDPTLQGVPLKNGRSGQTNLNYLNVPYDIVRALKQIKTLYRAKTVGFISEGTLFEAAPKLAKNLQVQASAMGLTLVPVPLDKEITKTLANLDENIDAVLVTPLNGLSDDQFNVLSEGLKARKLPSFSFLSSNNVERGILGGDMPKRYIKRLRRRLAINIQRTLLGDDPKTFPVFFEAGATRLWLNLDTAQAIGFEPSWTVTLEAKTIQTGQKSSQPLDFDTILAQVTTLNLDIQAEILARDSGLEDIAQARANLLPSFDLSVSGRAIDSDRATASMGNNPQYSGSASLTAQQVIYAEQAWAGLSIQKSLQGDKESALRALKLDTLQATAVAYFNVLRTQSLIGINTQNLEVARENLELALIRQSVGSANAAESLRWKSEIARSKQTLIASFASHAQTRIQLNRLLNRPDLEPFAIASGDIQDHALLKRFGILVRFLDNRTRLNFLSDFLAEESLQNAPELARIDAAIEAQRRDLTRVQRSYFVPDVILQGDITASLFTGGDGSETPALPPGIESPDDFNLQALLIFSLPLYDGGARYSESDQASIEIKRLGISRDSLAQKLRQNVRSELFNAMSSFSAIELRQEQADAARESLNIVADAYAAGSVSIADLIDAQNNAFAADQGVINAIYDFMINMANVERAMGSNHILQNSDDRRAFITRLTSFFKARGLTIPSQAAQAP